MFSPEILQVSVSNVKNTAIDKNYKKFEGLYKLTSMNNGFSFAGYDTISVTKEEIDDSIYTDELLLSDRYKIFWSPNIGLYNLYYCNFTQFLEMFDNAPEDSIILINKKAMSNEAESHHFTFILKWLDSIGREWAFFDPQPNFYAKNFYKTFTEVISKEMIDRLYTFSQQFLTHKNIKPFRKVYVSRRHIASRNYHWIKPGLSSNKDDRLIDHEILESFLKENGFEVIIPEEYFNTFEEQMNYFNETKVLVSLSSSGISNSLFMQPNTTVVEFITTYPLALGGYDENNKVDGVEGIHHLYHAQAYLKNHDYVGIPNHTRLSKDLISKIEQSKILKNIFME